MKALCYHGKGDVRVDTVPDPKILDDRDAIIRVTSTAICGSDLHLFDGIVPTMEKGDILGHEFMGEVVEVGSGASGKLKVGDRVVVPFTIACGQCFFCSKTFYSCCDRSNPNEAIARKAMGHSPSGLFGYSHMLGGYSGGQAEYVRVPFADVGPFKVPDGLEDEKVLFLSDIFPTAYMAAENAEIEEGDTVAIWGAGPVGQLTAKCAWMFKAGRVIVIDEVAERLALAQRESQAEIINFSKDKVYDRLMELTGGRGPDRVIDCVGSEAAGHGSIDGMIDIVKQETHLATDRPHVVREALMSVRKAGNISTPGVYFGMLDAVPFGSFVGKALTWKSGQTHVQRYLPLLMEKIQGGEIDPSFIITHRGTLDDAPGFYKTFHDRADQCIKCVMNP